MTETNIQGSGDGLRRAANLLLVVLLVIAGGDALLFGYEPGINIFLFVLILIAGIVLANLRHFGRPARLGLVALGVAAALPLVESPSLVGVLVALLGLAMLSLGSVRLLPARISAMPWLLVRFELRAPFRLIELTLRTLTHGLGFKVGHGFTRGLLAWVVPAIFAAIFLVLFASANPLIEAVLNQVDFNWVLRLLDPARIVLWFLILFIAWPLLQPRIMPWRKTRRVAGILTDRPVAPRENPLFGRAAILRSLVVFNALFAVQTVLDLAYLWGGVGLPEGMSHADYAHRGAYPLIATALLAAAFVLAAMRPGGPAEQSRLIRPLVYAWIGQNVLLCISSILRLDLYVEVYSLTEMRVAAGIWMGLVAVGLTLILARIALRKSNGWLIGANLVTLAVTVYASAFIDFDAIIARFNVEHSREIADAKDAMPLDIDYMLSLGPSAMPAIYDFLAEADLADDERERLVLRIEELHGWREVSRRHSDWRSWTLRGWRLDQYLAAREPIASGPSTSMY